MKKTKAKKILSLSLILIVTMVIGLLPQMAMPVFATSETPYSSGVPAGTSSAPVTYTISNEAQLSALATKVNSGTTYQYTTFVLQDDIALNAAWTPIGAISCPFKGTFDGNNKKISQVKIGSSTTAESILQYVGLFGYVDSGTIKNLGVNIAINSNCSNGYVGSLVASNYNATITNCYATGTVTGGSSANVGGLVGYSQSAKITNCHSTGIINGGSSAHVGGLVGGNYGDTITNCYATGAVGGGNTSNVGGLLGWGQNTPITNCYATGDVFGGSSANVGGLLGLGQSMTITKAYWNSNAEQNVWGARTDAAKLGVGSGADSATKMTSTDMKDAAFVTTLNNNCSGLSGTSTWVPTSGGYPTFFVPTTTIAKPITIGTTAPVTAVVIADGTNTVPTGATAPVITWSDDGTAYATASGNFSAGTEYKTKYVYTASTGYEFDSTIAASNITVINGGAVAVVLSDANKTLTITVTWPITASNACDITGFSFASPTATGTITGTNIDVIVPYGTTVTNLIPTIAVSAKSTISPISGTGKNFTDPVIYTVTAEDGTKKEYTVTVTVAADPDIATVNNAKSAAESAPYAEMNQAAATSEDAIKDALKSTATTEINNNGVTVTINKESYAGPVAGTSADPAGTNGSYEFTVTVSKGSQTQITEKKTITIKATAFTGVSDVNAVAAAKTAIKDDTVTVAFGADQTAKTAAVQSYVNGLLTGDAAGVTATVSFNSGTGKYDVVISKGSVEDATTITMTITEEADPDIETVINAKNEAESASYADMTQSVATDETVVEAALKGTAESAVNNNTVNVTVTKESYTAPVAGTSANPAGTNGSYVFKITVSRGVQTLFTSQKTITIAATPYAEIPTYKIIGIVQDGNRSNVQDATVKLMHGQNQVGLSVQTDADGKFTIENVVNGTYNLVVSKNGITVTILIVVNNTNNTLEGAIILPSRKTNSVVEVKPSTPSIVVGGLDKQFQATATEPDKGVTSTDNDVVTNGGSVEIKLIAEKKDNTATNASDISATATSNGKTVGIFVDLSVLKSVKDGSGVEISSQSTVLTELPSLIDVFIPLPMALQGKSNYVVYRYHGSADSITTEENTDGEKIELVDNNTTIKLTVKKFSTYGIAYTTPSNPSTHHSSGSGTSSSVVSPIINTETSKGGKITISNDKKTATITPNDGYVIADVIVDGKSIGGTEKYIFTDSKDHKISVAFVKKSELPYYIKNGEKVYIGFAAIAGNLYKYIVPTSETVEFGENQKNFTDNTIAWAKASIDFVTKREIFLGASQDTFSPNESMTRAMFVTAIGRLYERSYGSLSENGSVSAISSFSDVNADAYYAKYVAWANEKGLIKGVGENTFAPNAKVTREQMAVIMLNFATLLKKADTLDGSLGYTDNTSISSWAMDGAKYCQGTKVITGREGGSFMPQGNATRAEVAAVITRFIENIVK